MSDDEPVGYDGMGAPLYPPQTRMFIPAGKMRMTPPLSAAIAEEGANLEPVRDAYQVTDLTYVYDPSPAGEPSPLEQMLATGQRMWLLQDGEPVGWFDPTEMENSYDEMTGEMSLHLYPTPRTWQSEGGDQA